MLALDVGVIAAMFGHTLIPLLTLALGVNYAASQGSFEYVVVGSGPGGGPLAVELAKAGHSVLLLEAGSDLSDDPLYQDINNFAAASNDPRSRWDFFVKHSDDPERELKYERMTWRTTNGSFYVGRDPPEGAEQLGIYYPRAATLGGCGSHNAAVYSLPSDDNWDYIANITGDPSWGASEMRKIYEEIENCHYLKNGTAGHGFTGWLDSNQDDGSWLTNATDGNALLRVLADASGSLNNTNSSTVTNDELRALVERDINGPEADRDQLTGIFGLATHTDATGQRFSSANYIKAALREDPGLPLTVLLDAFLTRIEFDQLQESEPPAVMAIRYVTGASAYRADPRWTAGRNLTEGFHWVARELIVAGGAFNTPQILKVSGVGPADELRRHNISVVADLPGVGANLGDNYEGSVVSLAAKPLRGFGKRYVVQLKTSASRGNRDIFLWPLNAAFEGFWPGYPEEYGPQTLGFAFVHMDPGSGSRGTVTLRSADPFEPPEINFRFFGGDEDAAAAAADLRAMVEAARFTQRARDALPPGAGLAPFAEMHPCAGAPCTDEAVAEYLRLQVYSHHASGTCAIGADDDPAAVLDSRFRVRGVRRLRVVDASAFPRPPGAFPVLPTFMISKKAAMAILEDRA
ncbi:GMC oxidoreductase [Durotheca rogersii]|uniref:GMC oxidoreductase n=1 Tax=Durotheca rogersii TaxID=419775 RepID=UPI00221E62B2|nr:GMC oxidoreductase [Durotheca rogersii]KAI5859808.1 GMC oxidoreductase [Durotheca rogersii]